MLSILKFITSNAITYFATIGLIWSIGFSISVALDPLSKIGRPKFIKMPATSKVVVADTTNIENCKGE